MINRLYIAAPLPLQQEAILLRRDLTDFGFDVQSRWLDGRCDTDEQAAERDFADIREVDALVLFNPEQWTETGTGGRHTEVGYALAFGMPVFIYGVRSNCFHALQSVRVASTLGDLRDMLKEEVGTAPEIAGAQHSLVAQRLMSSRFMILQLMTRVHKANARWWRNPATGVPIERNVGELLMLVTSELAEALEGHRKNLPDDKLTHRSMFEVELADALIRLFDIGGGMRLDLAGAFAEKMDFNAVREDHTDEHRLTAHGKRY